MKFSLFVEDAIMESGIYEIVNLVNGKRYIGSAVNLYQRWADHRSTANRGIHKNRKLQAAWNKYGEESFRFSILLYCAEADLVFYEQRAMDAFDVVATGYNLSPTAGNCLGVKHTPEACANIGAAKRGMKHSAETKAKMSASHTGKKFPSRKKPVASVAEKAAIRMLGNQVNVGRKHTPEHIAKVVAKTTGQKRAPRSAEWSAKIGDGNRGKKQSPEHLAKRFSPEARAKMSAAATARAKRAREQK